MSEEPNPAMTRVELMNAMVGLAAAVRALFMNLIEEGFSAEEALKITMQYVHGVAGGKAS